MVAKLTAEKTLVQAKMMSTGLRKCQQGGEKKGKVLLMSENGMGIKWVGWL